MSSPGHEAAGAAERAPGGPIFIVGPMGSGTTLMRLIVDSHEHVAIAQETSIMRAYLAHKWIPFHRHGGEWYGRLGWSEEELDERLRVFYTGMFQRFATQQGKRRWGDKTPWHLWHLREIVTLFPDAVVIALVRHPGAVAASVSERFRHGWTGAVDHWVETTTEQVQRAVELGDRFLLVRYEDLVGDPETTLREVFGWLDEPWSDRLLEHDKVHVERGTATLVEGATRSDRPIEVDRVTAWREDRTEEEMTRLRDRTADLATFYGYDVDEPAALESMAVPGSARSKTVTGSEMALRKADMPAQSALLDRPVVGWEGNRMLTPESFGRLSRPGARAVKKAAPAPPAPPRRNLLRRVGRRLRRSLP